MKGEANAMTAAERLRAAKTRATPARVEILSFLGEAKSPEPIEAIRGALAKKRIPADLATVYRALGSLGELGLIDSVTLGRGPALYEAAWKKHHHHIACISCGMVEDVSVCADGIEERALRRSARFQSIERHSIDLFGFCISCSKKR